MRIGTLSEHAYSSSDLSLGKTRVLGLPQRPIVGISWNCREAGTENRMAQDSRK